MVHDLTLPLLIGVRQILEHLCLVAFVFAVDSVQSFWSGWMLVEIIQLSKHFEAGAN